MSTSIVHTIGKTIGKGAAYTWEGSRLASTQLAQGAREGYAEKSAELRARRLAVMAAAAAAGAPAVQVQSRITTRTVAKTAKA